MPDRQDTRMRVVRYMGSDIIFSASLRLISDEGAIGRRRPHQPFFAAHGQLAWKTHIAMLIFRKSMGAKVVTEIRRGPAVKDACCGFRRIWMGVEMNTRTESLLSWPEGSEETMWARACLLFAG